VCKAAASYSNPRTNSLNLAPHLPTWTVAEPAPLHVPCPHAWQHSPGPAAPHALLPASCAGSAAPSRNWGTRTGRGSAGRDVRMLAHCWTCLASCPMASPQGEGQSKRTCESMANGEWKCRELVQLSSSWHVFYMIADYACTKHAPFAIAGSLHSI
jgi:hypothetical protein